jgi:hypothetical protein
MAMALAMEALFVAIDDTRSVEKGPYYRGVCSIFVA